MRRWMFLMVPLLVAGCATWGQGGFDGGRSFDNRFDTAITTSNVTQLHEVWKLPGNTPVIGGGRVFDSLNDPNPFVRHALVAYPEAGCTGSGVPTCAESWSLGGRFGPPATDGTSVFAVDVTNNVLHVVGVDGTPNWTYTPAPIANTDVLLNPTIRIDNGRAWLITEDVKSGVITSRLVSLPVGGCGATTCSATLTIAGNHIDAFVATEGTVLASRPTTTAGTDDHVIAYEPTTGAVRWRSEGIGTVVAARDGRAYALGGCTGNQCGAVYPLEPAANCSGTPKTCTPIASIASMTNGPVLTRSHAVVINTSGVEFGATWYPNDCTGVCPTIAMIGYNDIPGPVGFAAQGGLVFTAGWPSLSTARIYAIDDALTNCPKGRCQPVFTTNAAAGVHALAVSSGRLYAAEDDGFVHVYGL